MREFEDSERNRGGLQEKGGGVTRREFLEMSVAATLAAGAEKIAWAADTNAEVPRRKLGRTGVKVSMVGMGGYYIGRQESETGDIRDLHTELGNGINMLDNAS